MKADFAWLWGRDAAPGAYSTSTAISDLPGILGMAASKFFVTVCAPLSWAEMGLAIERARAAQLAAMMVRIFMGFLALGVGRSSFWRCSYVPRGFTPYF